MKNVQTLLYRRKCLNSGKCKLCLDSVQREEKVGYKRLVGLDKMDKKLGWKSKDV